MINQYLIEPLVISQYESSLITINPLIDHSTNASIDGRQALGAEIEGEASGCGVRAGTLCHLAMRGPWSGVEGGPGPRYQRCKPIGFSIVNVE